MTYQHKVVDDADYPPSDSGTDVLKIFGTVTDIIGFFFPTYPLTNYVYRGALRSYVWHKYSRETAASQLATQIYVAPEVAELALGASAKSDGNYVIPLTYSYVNGDFVQGQDQWGNFGGYSVSETPSSDLAQIAGVAIQNITKTTGQTEFSDFDTMCQDQQGQTTSPCAGATLAYTKANYPDPNEPTPIFIWSPSGVSPSGTYGALEYDIPESEGGLKKPTSVEEKKYFQRHFFFNPTKIHFVSK